MILNTKKFGFTLAEVLITLGIIGIVAEMTIPTLMNSTREMEFKTGYKKAFSETTQVWMMAMNDDKIVSRTGWGDLPAKITNFEAFKSYFKVIKDCSAITNDNCWAVGELFYNAPDGGSITDSFIDASGRSWSVNSNAWGGSEILVDVNGLKKPNKYGQDRFPFYPVTSDGNAATAGVPTLINATSDVMVAEPNSCPSGASHPCYYQSWLFGK